jgi:hypothetical protein
MDDWAGELGVSRLTRALLDATVRLEGLGDRVRQVGRPFMLATLSTIPDPCHEILAPDSNRTLELLAAEGVQYPIALLQALLGELPGAQLARDRVKAGAIRNGSTAVAA